MKHLILLLTFIMFLATHAVAQISTTLSEGSYYYVVVAGDTVSQHNRLDKAIESASEATMMGGDWEIVQNYRLRGSSYFYNEDVIIEEVVDTVEVPIYSTNMPDHIIMLENIEFNMDRDASGNEMIDFIITTQPDETDTLYTEVRCGTEWVENNIFVRPAEELLYGLIWDCDSRLTYSFTAINNEGWEETVTNTYPLFMTETEQWGGGADGPTSFYTDFTDSEVVNLTQTWGMLTYGIENSILTLTLPERSIARVRWDAIPEHRNIRVTVTETVDESHGTGIHLAMRSSEAAREGSVETFLNQSGMGVSIFSNGNWSNPHTFPIEWEYGVPITYTVELIEDTITVTHNETSWSFTSDEISAIPNGTLMFGSTGAGVYYIDQLDVEILE